MWEEPGDYDGPKVTQPGEEGDKRETATGQDYPKWSKMYDPASEAYYYYNNETGDTQWDVPSDYEEPKKGEPLNLPPSISAVLKIQSAFRAKKARRKVKATRGKAQAEGATTKWTPTLDPSSGYYYYYNTETQECVWEEPGDYDGPKVTQPGDEGDDENGSLPEWVEVYDPGSESYYYYNNFTGETTWEKPKGYKKPDYTKLKYMMAPELRAAIMLQCAWRAKKSRGDLRSQRGKAQAEDGQVWSEVLDPQSGEYYYYNSETGESSWEKPLDLMTEEEKEQNAKLPEWVEVYDPSSTEYYYFNNFTGETTWEKPKGYQKPDYTQLKYMMAPELRAAIMLQCAWRAKKSRGDLRSQRGKAQAEDGEVWSEVLDPQSGEYYYYNSETGESSWEKPLDLMTEEEKEQNAKLPEWVEVYDPSSTEYYYFNNFTGETTWEKPKGYKKPDYTQLKYMMAPELRAAIMLQCAWRAKKSRGDLRSQRGKAQAEDGEVWSEVLDPQSGEYYYYNSETGESSWEKPRELMTEEEKNADDDKAVLPEWLEIWDSGQSTFYYYNQFDGTVTWDKPENFKRPNYASMKALMKPEVRAAVLVQNAWRKKLARRDVRAQRGKMNDSDELWQTINDPATGADYYYNSETGDVQWEKPRELMTEEEKNADDDKAVLPEWLEIWDSGQSTFYYYNQFDGTVTWDKPENFKRPNYANMKALMKPEVRAAVLVQNAWRKKLARRDVRAQRGKMNDSDELWQAINDPATGLDYYYNSETGDVQWEKPRELMTEEEKNADDDKAVLPEWLEIWDSGQSTFYYYNQFDGTVTWDKPENFKRPNYANMKALMKPEVRAAVLVQNAWRKKLARRDVRAQRGKMNDSDELWQTINDPATGLDYYYNSETGDVQWEKPRELMTEEEKNADDDKADLPEWLEIWDSGQSTFYYYNQFDGTVTWDKPENFKRPNYANMKALMKPEVRAAVLVQNAWRKKLARRDVRAQRGKMNDSDELWQTINDPATGLDYYYNSETGDVQWEKPRELMTEEEKNADDDKAVLPEWLEIWDSGQSTFYYYNQFDGTVTWDKPENFKRPNYANMKALMKPEVRAAVLVQNAWRKKLARRDVRAQRGKMNDSDELWQTINDPATGADYYYNSETGEVQWEKPEELLTEEEKANMGKPDWVQTTDESSGKVYYYDANSGEVTWTKPEGVEVRVDSDAELMKKMQLAFEGKLVKVDLETQRRMSAVRAQMEEAKRNAKSFWAEVYDEDHDAFYYYNVETNETTWEKPDDFVMEASDDLLRAALKIQSVFRAKVARGEVRLARAQNLAKDDGPLWIEVTDPASGFPYYYNRITNEVTWERPGAKLTEHSSESAPPQAGSSDALLQEIFDEEAKMKDEEERLLNEKESKMIRDRKAAKEEKKRLEAEKVRLSSERAKAAREARIARILDERAKRKAEKEEAKRKRIEAKIIILEQSKIRREKEKMEEYLAEIDRTVKASVSRLVASVDFCVTRDAINAERSARLREEVAVFVNAQDAWKARVEEDLQLGVAARADTEALSIRRMRADAQKKRRADEDKRFHDVWIAIASPECSTRRCEQLLSVASSKPQFDVNAKNGMGETLLHIAAWHGRSKICRNLLSLGADPSAFDSPATGITPIMEAARAGWTRIANMLEKAGADKYSCDNHGDNTLHWSIRGGHTNHCRSEFLDVTEHIKRAFIDCNFQKLTPAHIGNRSSSRGVKAVIASIRKSFDDIEDKSLKKRAAMDMESKAYRNKFARGKMLLRKNVVSLRNFGAGAAFERRRKRRNHHEQSRKRQSRCPRLRAEAEARILNVSAENLKQAVLLGSVPQNAATPLPAAEQTLRRLAQYPNCG